MCPCVHIIFPQKIVDKNFENFEYLKLCIFWWKLFWNCLQTLNSWDRAPKIEKFYDMSNILHMPIIFFKTILIFKITNFLWKIRTFLILSPLSARTVPCHKIWWAFKECTERYFGRIELGVGAKWCPKVCKLIFEKICRITSCRITSWEISKIICFQKWRNSTVGAFFFEYFVQNGFLHLDFI